MGTPDRLRHDPLRALGAPALPPPTTRRRRGRGIVAATLAVTLGAAGATAALTPASAAAPQDVAASVRAAPADDAQLRTWLADTYASLEAMTSPATGLPSDNIEGTLDPATASAYTSPTNIGGYLWSTIVARDLGLIDTDTAYERMSQTLDTLTTMDRHDESGMYYNWYDPATGDRVDVWPDDGTRIEHFLSSVDNGWLAAALRAVAEAEPLLADAAGDLYDSMHFGIYYNPDGRPDLGVGLIRGGFWDEEPTGCSVAGNYRGGEDVFYTCHHYDTTVSETRIALYLGITDGEIPPEAYYGTHRTFPSTCDWDWQEQRPSGITRTYSGVDVYEGVYHYRGMALVPGWGGSMFEALMPDMLVPESQWAPTSWGLNHPLIVRAQKEHGMDEAGYGYWGFSPASNPSGGYAEYGVEVLGLRSDGYPSDGATDVDGGFFGCREGSNPDPVYEDGVVTPHASFLGLEYDPEGVVANLTALTDDFDSYGPGGFYDAIAVRSGIVAKRYLSLDQSMIVAAIGNYLGDGLLRDYVTDPVMEERLRPVLASETFSAAAEPTAPVVTKPAPGSTVTSIEWLAGTGEPGAHLMIEGVDGPWCTADVDADGDWACTLTPVTATAAHLLAVSTTNDAGFTVAGDAVTITVAVVDPVGLNPPTEVSGDGDPIETAGGSDAGAQADPGGNLATTGASVGLALLAALAATLVGAAFVMARRRRATAG